MLLNMTDTTKTAAVAPHDQAQILAQAMPWGIASKETFTAAFKSARNAVPE